MDFKGLRQLVVNMMGGQKGKIDVESFQNDITSFHSADDVMSRKHQCRIEKFEM